MIATTASLCVATAGLSGPLEDCLDAPTVACVATSFAEGADLPLRAVSASDRDTLISWLLRALRALGHAEEAERVSWREERGAYAPDRAVDIAVARFLASARSDSPDFTTLDGLADPASPLAPLIGRASDPVHAAWDAHWRAGYALLGQVAAQAGVSQARDAPMAARAALRDSPAWRGLMDGLARWNERIGPAYQSMGWRLLAQFRLELGDADAARGALNRASSRPADPEEVELWWRLGDPARAGDRARASADPFVLGRHFERAAQEATARGDFDRALATLEEAWTLAVLPRRFGLDFRYLRRLVRLTATALCSPVGTAKRCRLLFSEQIHACGPSGPPAICSSAGDQTLAVARAEAIRDLPASGTLVPEAHWVDAAAALNDIGAHDAAMRILRALLALRPADLSAAGFTDAAPAAPGTVIRGHSPRARAAVELHRAGLQDAAARLLRAALSRGQPVPGPTRREDVEALLALGGLRVTPEAAERLARSESLSQRALWRMRRMSDVAIEISEAMRWDAAIPERVAGLLALSSTAPSRTRAYLLLEAARGDAEHGRRDAAAARLAEATEGLVTLDQPHEALCDTMAQAAGLGRTDIADAAFRIAVAAARREPEVLRPEILLDAAACRAAPLRN